jgi:hypothetical protein
MKKLCFAFIVLMLASCADEKTPKEAAAAKDSASMHEVTDTVDGTKAIDTVKTTVATIGDGAIPLKFNLRVGKKYDYQIKFDLTQQAPNRQMTTTMDVNYDLAVVGESAGMKTIQITYDRLAMIMNMGGQKMELNSDMDIKEAQGPLGMVGGIFRAMKGKSFTMKVNSEGQIKEVKGFEEIGEAVVEEFKVAEGTKESLKNNFKNQFNEKTARESFSNSFDIFPDKPVKVGDSWKKTANTSVGIAQKMVTTYTVKEIKGNRVTIDAVSDMQLKDSSKTGQTARLIVDARTGLVTRGTFEQQSAGKMKVSSKGTITGKEL